MCPAPPADRPPRPETPAPQAPLSLRAAAAHLGLPGSTVRSWVARGWLETTRGGDGRTAAHWTTIAALERAQARARAHRQVRRLDARQARAVLEASATRTIDELARAYGVSRPTIRNLLAGETYKDIAPPGVCPRGRRLRRMILLTAAEIAALERLGDGDLSAGVRRAVALLSGDEE